jgi:hypothetical protein
MAAGTENLAIFDPRVQVIDHDPQQWSNLFDILLPPGPRSPAVFLLHRGGRLLSVWPGRLRTQVPGEISDPRETSRILSQRFQATVCVIEVASWKRWLESLQRELDSKDDILSLVLRAKNGLVREGAYGVVIHPDPFAAVRDVLPHAPAALLRRVVPEKGHASIVLGVLGESGIHASLVIEVTDASIRTITTCPDNGEYRKGDLRARGAQMMKFAADRFCPAVIGLFCDRETLEKVKKNHWKAWAIMEEIEKGTIACLPEPDRILSLFRTAEKRRD